MLPPMPVPLRLRSIRKQRGLTIEALAKRVGIDNGHLSRIERGEKTPSLGTLMALSKALGTSMAELLGDTVADGDVAVIRQSDRPTLRNDPRYRIEAVLPATNHRPLAIYVIEPGAEFLDHDELQEHAGFESILVLGGTVEIELADRLLSLSQGDCAAFDAKLRHRLRRAGSSHASALVMITLDD
jgi:transcriptional regulator with XRE-family HTH domain